MSDRSELIERLKAECELPEYDHFAIVAVADIKEAIAALGAVPVWASGQTLSEDELCDWLTEHAWDSSEDCEPVWVVDKESLKDLFKNTILVLVPSLPAPPIVDKEGK